MPGPSEIEIRPLFDAADIAAVLSPEAAKRRGEWEAQRERSALPT
jgi:hypothetical protein